MPFDAQAQGEYMSIGAPPISPFANREGFSQAPYALFQSQEIYALEQKTIFQGRSWNYLCLEVELAEPGDYVATHRSEERRVGKECDSTCRSRGLPEH